MNRNEMVLMFGVLVAAPAVAQDSTATREAPKARMDRFVDSDGDGICDQRARGLGFRRGLHRGMTKAAGGTVTPATTDQAGQPQGTGRKQYHGGKK